MCDTLIKNKPIDSIVKPISGWLLQHWDKDLEKKINSRLAEYRFNSGLKLFRDINTNKVYANPINLKNYD